MKKLTVQQALTRAEAYLKKGDLDSARELYVDIIRRFPGNNKAVFGLAQLDRAQHNQPVDREQLEKAIAFLGTLHNANRHAELAKAATQFIQKYPRSFELWMILAGAQNSLDQTIEAEKSFRKVIELKPDYAEAHSNLGVILESMGRLDDAISAHRSALEVNPQFYIAHFNLGNVYKDTGRLEDAVNSYRAAVAIMPFFAQAYINLGIVLVDLYRLDEAVAAYQHAITMEPGNASAYNNLGLALTEKGLLDNAILNYQKALSINPKYADAQFNLGLAFTLKKNATAAIEAFRAVLKLEPSHVGGLSYLSFELAKQCDWHADERLANYTRNLGVVTAAVNPFQMLALEDNPENQLARSKRWAEEKLNVRIAPMDIRVGKKNKRLRIGIFSGDFREHPMMYCISGLLGSYDRSKFELLAFNLYCGTSEKWSTYVKSALDSFFDVSIMSNAELIAFARSKELDIAIDLSGYTTGARTIVFVERVASVQINFLGYPGTMGIESYDYIISDKIVIPDEYRKYYSEKIIFLPHTYFPIDNSGCSPTKETARSDHGLHDDQLILCSFNNSYKLTRVEFSIWMRILARVDNAVLWLLQTNNSVEQNLRSEALNLGIDPKRLIFAPFVDKPTHLERHRHADLFLDTFNCNAHTTACDALWSGVPIVTKVGRQFAARVAASILFATELSELVTYNEADYENLVTQLAMSPSMLKTLKDTLLKNKETCPLFDVERYTRNFEKGILSAHQDVADEQRRDIIVVD
jgi:predicted O-linked N-acetylglucosamine transferase (SPINDLY family)